MTVTVADVRNWCNQYGGTTCKGGKKGVAAKKAKGKASKPKAVKHDAAKGAVGKINKVLSDLGSHSHESIGRMVDADLGKLSLSALKKVGKRMEGPETAKSKKALLAGWKHWLGEMRSSWEDTHPAHPVKVPQRR